MKPEKAFDAADALGLDSSTSVDESDYSGDVADSPPAEDVKQPTLLDVVRDAVAPESSTGEDSEEDQDDLDSDEAEEETGDGDQAEEEDQEDDQPRSEEDAVAQLIEELREEGRSLQKIERFREVLSENKQLKSEVDELQTIRSQLSEITVAAQKSGLEDQLVADLWATPLLFAQDPVAAVQKLREATERLAEMVGDKLPSELQTKVDDGYLTEEDARELSRARAEAARLRQMQEYESAEREKQSRESQLRSLGDAVNTYQQSLVQNDPDYTAVARKWHRDRFAQMYEASGRPQDMRQVVSLAEQSWKEIKSDLTAMIPKPKPKSPIAGRRANNAPPAAPASMFDAISQAVGGASSED
jgi:hypothetical protein